jgi:hypothetical protein
MIKTDPLSKHFGATRAVDDVSFEVHPDHPPAPTPPVISGGGSSPVVGSPVGWSGCGCGRSPRTGVRGQSDGGVSAVRA